MRALLATLCLLLACPAAAQPLEHEVKAAFLFRFLPYVEWPQQSFEAPGAPLTIGVLGAPHIEDELRHIIPGRTVHGRPVVLRQLKEGESARGLHVLFVGRAASERVRAVTRLAPWQPLLVVSESPGALEQGAVVNFLVADGRVGFEIALDEAERRALRISSRMLGVAVRVRPPNS